MRIFKMLIPIGFSYNRLILKTFSGVFYKVWFSNNNFFVCDGKFRRIQLQKIKN